MNRKHCAKFRGCKLFLAALVGLYLAAIVCVAQGARTSSSTLQSRIDPDKPTTGCNGNFIQGHRLEDGSLRLDPNQLRRIYDFDEIRLRAQSSGYRVIDNRRDVSFRIMQLDEFNRDYNPPGPPMRIGDAERRLGPAVAVRTYGSSRTHVELTGPVLEIEKRVAPREVFFIRLEYGLAGRDSYPQQISVRQEGRCNLRDSYIRDTAKRLLDDLGIESDWVDTTAVVVNTIN